MATDPLASTEPDVPDAVSDPDRSMARRMRASLIVMVVLVFGIGAAMTFVPIGGAVVGSGQVGVESRIKRVAHPTGGIIAALYVADGDHVARGDVVLRLDDGVSGSQSDLSSLSVDQLTAQRARLEAERLGVARIAFPAELRMRDDPAARRAMADENKLFNLRRAEQAGMRGQLAARMAQYRKQIEGYRAQMASLRRQVALIEPEQASVRELWERNLVTIGRLNQIERTSAELTGGIGSLTAQIAQAQARIAEAGEQLLQLNETRRADAGDRLSSINGTLNQERIRNVDATDRHERSVIRAPYSGTVDKLAFAAIGDVVRPAETIMEIVPDHDRLLIEGMVRPGDIDQVARGQRARIRFTAFNSTASPDIAGRVSMVAPERTTDAESRQSFYAVRIEVDPRDLARWPELKLRPGMPAEIFVETGSRSMLSYLTKPLRDQFARAFRDN